MTPTLLTVVFAVVLSAGLAPSEDAPRKPNPLAPSLPLLTSAEENHLDKVIDRFMQFDTGQLRGEDGKTALHDFIKLGPESIPALIRGINRAAVMEQSCPTLVIAKKLKTMLLASDDQDLLEFARDEIGAGVERSRHMNVLQDLRVMCMLRRNALVRLEEKTGIKPPRKMTTSELADATAGENGPRIKLMLAELEQRKGPEVLRGLASAAGSGDKDVRQLGRDLLDKYLARQGIEFIQKQLKDDRAEVRQSAARSAAKYLSLAEDLIALLGDSDRDVAGAAHQSLVKISGGDDFGPLSPAKTDIDAARKKWQAWWDKERGK
jgi:hypothetical protein